MPLWLPPLWAVAAAAGIAVATAFVFSWIRPRRGFALGDAATIQHRPRVRIRRSIRFLLGSAVLTAIVAAYAAAPLQTVREGRECQPGSSGMIVIDFSGSIGPYMRTTIGEGIQKLIEGPARGKNLGIVPFSDDAYEALAPDACASDLRRYLPYFLKPALHKNGAAQDPWRTFVSGTELSLGLHVALRAIERDKVRPATVVVVSDFELYGDWSEVAIILKEYARAGVKFRAIPVQADEKNITRMRRAWTSALRSVGDNNAARDDPFQIRARDFVQSTKAVESSSTLRVSYWLVAFSGAAGILLAIDALMPRIIVRRYRERR